jgi:predicted RNase H-like nuclease (RuvC/YqgF family)
MGGILPMLLVISTLSGGIYFYYTSTQETIQQLRENNFALEAANKTNQETISQMEQAAELSKKLNKELTDKYNEAESRVNTLRDKLIDHDLTNLSLKKPGLIEKRINNGTDKAFKHLESITAIKRVQPMAPGADSGDGNQDQNNSN